MSSAIDTASRFGDIPFVDFTKGLVNGVFETLIESHISQMEAYNELTQQLTVNLSTYINNTAGNVDFNDITNFILTYDLPEVDNLDELLDNLISANANTDSPDLNDSTDNSTWWSSLITNLTPVVNNLVGTIENPNTNNYYNSLESFNNITADKIPTYQNIYEAIASLISYNKYGLLENMAKQGVMRLIVTDGLIETKLTFSTYDKSTKIHTTKHKDKTKVRSKYKEKRGFRLFGIGRKRKYKEKNKIVTINTAKSYQRDTSGTSVNIFGRVLINFKTDYAPLNG